MIYVQPVKMSQSDQFYRQKNVKICRSYYFFSESPKWMQVNWCDQFTVKIAVILITTECPTREAELVWSNLSTNIFLNNKPIIDIIFTDKPCIG